MKRFARPPDDWTRARLALPRGCPRVVIDTDAANEIDDPFAIAWALLSPAQLRVEAVCSAPCSFAHRRQQMLQARIARDEPGRATDRDREMLVMHGAALAHFDRQGWDPATVALAPFDPPEAGLERSHAEILRVFERLGQPPAGRVWRGSAGYLHDVGRPPASEAAERLVAAALAGDDDDPLYVLAIGVLTNVASALLRAPEIARRIVVVWTAGYPSHAPQPNHAFNLEQDPLACRVVLASGVPLVYLPGYHVGAQLRLSAPEAEIHLKGRSAIGDHLYHLFTHNPLWPLVGITDLHVHSWVIWDLINVAWLLDPGWVPSDLVRTPRLGPDLRWCADAGGPWMREAYAVRRDAIFRDLFGKIAAAC